METAELKKAVAAYQRTACCQGAPSGNFTSFGDSVCSGFISTACSVGVIGRKVGGGATQAVLHPRPVMAPLDLKPTGNNFLLITVTVYLYEICKRDG